MKKKKASNLMNVLRVGLSLGLIIMMGTLILFLEADGSFQWATLDDRFWVLKVLQVVYAFFTYLSFYDTAYGWLTNNVYGNVWIHVHTFLLRVDLIHAKKLRPQLEEAVKVRNREKYEEAATATLRHVCDYLDYETVGRECGGWETLTAEKIDEYASRTMAGDKRAAKHLRKAICAVKKGSVDVDMIYADNIVDKGMIEQLQRDMAGKKIRGYAVSGHVFQFVKIVMKIVLFTCFTITNMALTNVVNGLISSIIIFFVGASAGVGQAYIIARYLRNICIANNDFFLAYMDIDAKAEIPSTEENELDARRLEAKRKKDEHYEFEEEDPFV